MAARLIVNADDYCRTSGVSAGIREAHRRGVVTSTTAMMNMPTAEEDVNLALQETPQLGLGVHLVLTSGRPLSALSRVPSLVEGSGSFWTLDQFLPRLGSVNMGEIEAEWRTQVERFIAAAGRQPTHLDSHHHSSYFTSDLFRIMLELARGYRCAIRHALAQGDEGSIIGLPVELVGEIREFSPRLLAEFNPRCPDAFFASFYDELATRQELLRIVDSLPEGTFEVMCHPGYVDPSLLSGSSYARQREAELEILTHPGVRAAIEARGIRLITFGDL